MKNLINLIIILSLSAQACHAQEKIKTVEEYKILFDSIALLVKPIREDSSSYVGISFSKFEKLLDKRGLKIMQVSIGDYDYQKVNPQYVYALILWLTTLEMSNFAEANDLRQPFIVIHFAESKSYEKTLSLMREYKGLYSEEIAAFYADAVIKSLDFSIPVKIYFRR